MNFFKTHYSTKILNPLFSQCNYFFMFISRPGEPRSVQSDPGSAMGLFDLVQLLGLFGQAKCSSWVCSVWPRIGLGSVRSGQGCSKSVQSGPYQHLRLLGLDLHCATQVRLAYICFGSRTSSWALFYQALTLYDSKRKEAMSYVTKKLIYRKTVEKCLIVEDVVTTENSLLSLRII